MGGLLRARPFHRGGVQIKHRYVCFVCFYSFIFQWGSCRQETCVPPLATPLCPPPPLATPLLLQKCVLTKNLWKAISSYTVSVRDCWVNLHGECIKGFWKVEKDSNTNTIKAELYPIVSSKAQMERAKEFGYVVLPVTCHRCQGFGLLATRREAWPLSLTNPHATPFFWIVIFRGILENNVG